MKRKINLVDKKFGRLTVIDYAADYVSPSGQKHTNCVCHCDCGNTIVVRASSLNAGLTVSCGCYNREKAGANLRKHGFAHKDPLYSVWKGMRERCTNPKQSHWNRYGGRGISVCSAWNDFPSFRAWALSCGWRFGLQIDRIDNDSGYSPENCRVVTCKENNDHRGHCRDAMGRYAKRGVA